jgi:hypothetical protein
MRKPTKLLAGLTMAALCLTAEAKTQLELDSYGSAGPIPYASGVPWEYKGTQTFTTEDGSFSLNRPYPGNPDYANSLYVSFDTNASYAGRERWIDLSFSTDQLGVPLAEGTYTGAQRFPFNDPGHPGLDMSDTGGGFNTLDGWFQIFDVQRNDQGAVIAFAASFKIFDYPAPADSPLIGGRIWYNSDAVIAPVPIPAAGWFFISGLAGLIGAARMRKTID